MLKLDSVAIVISLILCVMIFVLAKHGKNESLNLKIDCDMVSPQSVIKHPVAYHFERLK